MTQRSEGSPQSLDARCICGAATVEADELNVMRLPVNGHCAWCPNRFKPENVGAQETTLTEKMRATLETVRRALTRTVEAPLKSVHPEDVCGVAGAWQCDTCERTSWGDQPMHMDDCDVADDEKALRVVTALLSGDAVSQPAPPEITAEALPDMSKVTRFEVIDHRHGAPSVGRVFVAMDATVTLALQDEGRTVKAFVDGVRSVTPATPEKD